MMHQMLITLLKRRRSKRSFFRPVFVGAFLLLWLQSVSVQQHGYQRSVKYFNATGNGTTDDRPAIQATIDDVAAHGGGVVYLPAGT
jgi:hypothetical protein